MALKSYTQCPSCASDVVLKKARRGIFRCPHCNAEFRHNYKRWAVAVPTMLFVTLLLFYLFPGLGIWIIIGGIFVTSLIIGGGSEFVVESQGQQVEPVVMTAEQKESRFFKIFVLCFFLVVMGALGWSLIYLLRFLLR